MEQMILVRYGQYENGHLTDEGREIMTAAASRIKEFLGTSVPMVISAPSPRAVESAKIVADALGVEQVDTYPQIYAADEEGLLPDSPIASKLFETLGEKNPVVVAIISREYIDTLPSYILMNVLGVEEVATSLNRGEALVLNYKTKEISYLK